MCLCALSSQNPVTVKQQCGSCCASIGQYSDSTCLGRSALQKVRECVLESKLICPSCQTVTTGSPKTAKKNNVYEVF